MELIPKPTITRIVLCSTKQAKIDVLKKAISQFEWLSAAQVEAHETVIAHQDCHPINRGQEWAVEKVKVVKKDCVDESVLFVAIQNEFRVAQTAAGMLIEDVAHCTISRGPDTTVTTYSLGVPLPKRYLDRATPCESAASHSDDAALKQLIGEWSVDPEFQSQDKTPQQLQVAVGSLKKVYMSAKLTVFPDYPKQGINFIDYSYMLSDRLGFGYVADTIQQAIVAKGWDKQATKVLGFDAKGFIHGSIVARELGIGLLIVRKKGKLPGKTIKITYSTEYSDDSLELIVGTVEAGDKIILVDDFIATGGTFKAGIESIGGSGKGEVIGCVALMHAEYLKEAAKKKLGPVDFVYCL